MKVYKKSKDDFFTPKKNENLLIETDRKIKIYDLLKIKGHLYTVCCIAPQQNFAEVKELNVIELPDEPEDHDFTNEVVCPYCESEIESFEMDDEDYDYECPYCHSHFSYQREVNITYNSQPISKAEAIELN